MIDAVKTMLAAGLLAGGTLFAATGLAQTTPAPTTTPGAISPAGQPIATPTKSHKKKSATATAAASSAGGSAVFPHAVDPQYAKLSAGAARRKTCEAQYAANKAGGGNGGMKWIQKGGGYYSACNKRLKGA